MPRGKAATAPARKSDHRVPHRPARLLNWLANLKTTAAIRMPWRERCHRRRQDWVRQDFLRQRIRRTQPDRRSAWYLIPETSWILRSYHAERWPVGTIARHLHVHRDSGGCSARPDCPDWDRACGHRGLIPICASSSRIRVVSAARQSPYDSVKARGHPGRPDHFRHLIARHRPRPGARIRACAPCRASRCRLTGATSVI